MKVLHTIFWEFIQNLPLVAGFVQGMRFWAQGVIVGAIVCIAAGSLCGALLIRWTESRIVEGHQESLRLVIANIVIFSAIMFVLSAYFVVPWGSWKTDILLGVVGGGTAGIIQNLAGGAKFDIRHSAAFAASFPVGFIGFRILMLMDLPAWVIILVITTAITVIISLIDYSPMFLRRSG